MKIEAGSSDAFYSLVFHLIPSCSWYHVARSNAKPTAMMYRFLLFNFIIIFLFYLFLLHLVSSQQGYSVLDNIRQDRTRRRKEKTKQYFRPVVSVSFHNRLRTPISFYAFCSTEKERIERIKKTSKSSVSGIWERSGHVQMTHDLIL